MMAVRRQHVTAGILFAMLLMVTLMWRYKLLSIGDNSRLEYSKDADILATTQNSYLTRPIDINESWDPSIFVYENSTDEKYEHSHFMLYATLLHPRRRCKEGTFLLVVIVTKPSNFKHRQAYRDTILHPIISDCLKDVEYLFIVGRTSDHELQRQLVKESEVHGDILQGNFVDSYQNLTYKSLFLLKWSGQNCPMAKYTFKLDDDVFTIIEDVHKYLKSQRFNKYSIFGSVFRDAKPIYDTSNKWHVKNFHGRAFPEYVSGTAYLLSRALLRPIFISAVSLPFVRLEDVFVTGISANHTGLNIRYHQFPGFSYLQDKLNIGAINFHTRKSIHGVNTDQLRSLHSKLITDRVTRCR